MYQSSLGIGAGSDYLGYIPSSSMTTSRNVSGIGAGSNYLGYVPGPVNGVSGNPLFPRLDSFMNQLGSSFSQDVAAVRGAISGFLSSLDFSNPDKQLPSTSAGVSSGAVAGSLDPSTLDFLYADLAKHYGMSKETAYQEALTNTSYQRAVKDMQAAGLNPAAIFGAGKGSGADGVSYVSSAAPSGSGGFSGRSVSKNKDNLFSSGAYYGLSAGIGLLAGILTKSPTGYWIGSQASQGFLGAANAVYKSMK